MSRLKEKTLYLRNQGVMKGGRPVFTKVLKGNYPYKGKYITTTSEEGIYFYQLSLLDKFKKKGKNFIIEYNNLIGYRYTVHSTYYKKITLIFKDELEFNFIFLANCEDAYDNQPNADYLMQKLKDMKVYQRNNLKGGKRGQKVISKKDQLFTKEVRSPSKKRGLFW